MKYYMRFVQSMNIAMVRADELIELRDNTENMKEAANKIRQKVIDWGTTRVLERHVKDSCADTIAPLVGAGMSTLRRIKTDHF